MQPSILMIEDDTAVATLTRDLFQREGFLVQTADTAAKGWDLFQKGDFDLLLLDLGLPDMEGMDFCAKVKSDPAKGKVPVFILTARGSSEDIVRGLEAGAEDYLSKPFNEREFLARVRAILRRHSAMGGPKDEIISGKVKLSPASHEVWCHDKPVLLTLREFDILRIFLENPGKALAREEIVRLAWGPSTAIVPKVVDVHVGHLRAKLGSEGKRLETVPQVGYKWLPPKK